MTRPYGVLGRTLGHSYTPRIYRDLAGLDYVRFEREPDEVEAFIRGGEWEGVNVTIPYKKVVTSLMDELTPMAERLGNVNTVTRAPDGRLVGDNTDYFGFKVLAESVGVDLAGKRALVLGGLGGAGSTCMTVLSDMGCKCWAVTREEDGTAPSERSVTYADLPQFSDASIVVNATPVGMFPRCPATPCSLEGFEDLEAVIDIVYNPARTALMMEAERLGVPAAGGLLMLVAQAAAAVERYTGEQIPRERILEVTEGLSADEQNIVFIGMPGAGKTSVGSAVARALGREHIDIDHELERRLKTSCGDYITTHGEEAFRAEETAVTSDVASRSGLVISCGGGVVTRPENYPLLHQNGRIIMLDRPLDELSSKGRPISQRDGVEKLAAARMPLYLSWADLRVASRESAEATAEAVLGELGFLEGPCARS